MWVCVHVCITTFSFGLYKTSVIESNMKSNLSVFFILQFLWVSTTAAITTVLPTDTVNKSLKGVLDFWFQLYNIHTMHICTQTRKRLLTAGWSSGSRALRFFVRYTIRGVVDGWRASWRWNSIRLLREVLTQSPQDNYHVILTEDQLQETNTG